MERTCPLCESGCVSLKNMSVTVCLRCGSYPAIAMDRASAFFFSCKCIADTNLMFSSRSEVQVITEKCEFPSG